MLVVRRRRYRKSGIPRPPREYRITRISSSNQALGGLPIFLSTDGTGRHQFTFGTTSPLTTPYFAMQFALSNFTCNLPAGSSQYVTPNYSDFTNMFDEYQLEGVQVMILASSTLGTGNPANTATFQLPFIVHATDADDANATQWAFLSQKGDARYTQLTQLPGEPKYLRKFRPRVAVSMYQTGLTWAYGNSGPQWINSAYPDVPHYGLKFALDDSLGTLALNTNMAQLNFIVKFHYRFRGLQ